MEDKVRVQEQVCLAYLMKYMAVFTIGQMWHSLLEYCFIKLSKWCGFYFAAMWTIKSTEIFVTVLIIFFHVKLANAGLVAAHSASESGMSLCTCAFRPMGTK